MNRFELFQKLRTRLGRELAGYREHKILQITAAPRGYRLVTLKENLLEAPLQPDFDGTLQEFAELIQHTDLDDLVEILDIVAFTLVRYPNGWRQYEPVVAGGEIFYSPAIYPDTYAILGPGQLLAHLDEQRLRRKVFLELAYNADYDELQTIAEEVFQHG